MKNCIMILVILLSGIFGVGMEAKETTPESKSVPVRKKSKEDRDSFDRRTPRGAWTLSENPIIYMHPVGVLCGSFNGIQTDEAEYRFTASGKSKAELKINPQLVPHVIRYDVECVPVSYAPNNNDASKLPQIPVNDYAYTDFGSLGAQYPSSAYSPYTPTNSKLYSNEDFIIFDNNAQGTVTYWRLWDKYGKNTPNMPLYKYIYAPANQAQCRGGEIKVGCKHNFAKVIVTMVTEFEGKRDTVITSRTYKPRFEWDPDLIKKYGNTSMSTLQGYAGATDPVLSTIDNGYYDRLLRENTTYNSVPKDSLEITEIEFDETL